MEKNVRIGGTEVFPGQRLTINLPVADLYTHAPMIMPVRVLGGRRAGPRLFVSAAIHGDEIIGVEIIRRLLNLKVLQRLRGTLMAVPVVNIFGFVNSSRYLPDRRDLNRFFPGSGGGSLTSRLADLFMTEIVANCTHGIDLHSGSNHRANLPQIRADLDDPRTRELAVAFGTPVVLNTNLRDGSLRQAVMERGIPMILYEAGEVLRFDELAIRAGVGGILAVMRHLGMLPRSRGIPSRVQPLVARHTSWVRAQTSGMLNTKMALGRRVRRKDRLGVIADPFGTFEEPVVAPVSGIIIGRLNLPLVHEGDAIFHIAQFDDTASATANVVEFQQEMFQLLEESTARSPIPEGTAPPPKQ